jgi:hypothetical protein
MSGVTVWDQMLQDILNLASNAAGSVAMVRGSTAWSAL